MAWLSHGATRPSPGSWLDRVLQRHCRHPSSFDCGVRVRSGTLAGERARWRVLLSAVDPLAPPGVVVLHHGERRTLHLRVGAVAAGTAARPHHLVVRALEVRSGAEVELSIPAGELERFGLEQP